MIYCRWNDIHITNQSRQISLNKTLPKAIENKNLLGTDLRKKILKKRTIRTSIAFNKISSYYKETCKINGNIRYQEDSNNSSIFIKKFLVNRTNSINVIKISGCSKMEHCYTCVELLGSHIPRQKNQEKELVKFGNISLLLYHNALQLKVFQTSYCILI